MDHTIDSYLQKKKKCLAPGCAWKLNLCGLTQTFLYKVTKRWTVHKAMRLGFSPCSAITSQATLGTTLKAFTYPTSSLWALVLSPGR